MSFALLLGGIGIFALPSAAEAANRYWVGSAGGNTNDTANWSSTDPASCTGGGASVPGTADIAIFDADCDNSATINANLSVLGFTISTGYIGTVTQAAGITLTVGTSDYSQSDGTFTGNSATIDMNDAFSLTGGTFTSTSGTMSVASAFTISGTPTFTHNSGTVQFDTSAVTLTPSTATFNNVSFTSAVTKTIADSQTLTVAGTLTLTDGSISQTTIPAAGSVSVTGASITQASTFDGGTGRIEITGTANQTFTGSATTTAGTIPDIEIDKSAGTLTLAGTIRTTNDWTWTAGTIDATTNDSTVVFGGTLTVTGSHGLDNVTVDSNSSGTTTLTIASGTTLTVNGVLTMDNSSTGTMQINTGTIDAKGNIAFDNTVANSGGNPATLNITGTSDQTMTSTSVTQTSGTFPRININKSSGTLILPSVIRTINNWTYTAGTLDTTTNNSTVVFVPSTGFTVSGSHTLNNVTVDSNTSNSPGSGMAIASGTTLTVNGTLTMDNTSTGDMRIDTGTLEAKGNIVADDNIINSGGVPATLLISGTGAQTFTGSMSATSGNLPIVNINKSSGTLTLSGTLRTSNNWTWTAGTLDATTNDSTVVFGSDGNMTVTGSHTLDNVTFDKGTGTVTIANSNTLTVAGTLTITNGFISQTTIPATGSIAAQGNIVQNSTSDGGTGRIEITGTANQTFTGNATASAGQLPNIEIDKSGGTLTLTGTIRASRDWTYTAGTLDATTNDSTVIIVGDSTHTITGSHTLDNVTLDGSSNGTFTIANSNTLTVAGTLTLTNGRINQTTIPSTGSISAQGNVTVGTGWDNGTETGKLVFSGSATQTFDLTGAEALLNTDVAVNKSGGQVNLASTFTANAANQDLIIEEGTFDLNGNNLTVNGTSGTLIVETGGNLQLQGGETITANATYPQLNSGSTVTYDGTATYTVKDYAYQHLTFNGSGGVFNLGAAESIAGNLTITAGTFDIEGFNLTVTGTFSNSDKLRLQGGETTVSLTNDTDSGTVEYDGTASYTSLKAGNNYYHLIFNGTGGTWTAAAAVDVNGNLTITAGTFVDGGNTVALAGNWSNAGSYTGTGTVTFDAASGTQTLTSGGTTAGFDFQNVTKGGGGGILQFVTNGVDIDGTLTIDASTTVDLNGQNLTSVATLVNNGTLLLEGGETVTITTKDTDSGIVAYDGTGSYLTALPYGNTYYNLTFNGAGGVWEPDGAVTVNNNLTISAGTFDIDGQNLTVTTAFSNDGTLRVAGNESMSFTNDTNSGIVTYDGSASYGLLAAGYSYYNLTFNGAGTWALGAALDANNNLTITAGTLNLNGFDFTVGGNFSNSGTLSNSSARTLTLDGTTQSVSPGAATTLGTLTLSGSSGTVTSASDFTLSVLLSIATGRTFNLSSFTLTSNGGITNSGTINESTGKIKDTSSGFYIADENYDIDDTISLGSDRVYVTLTEEDGNLDGLTANTLSVTVSCTQDSEALTLTETGNATEVFRYAGGLATALYAGSATNNNGTLTCADAVTITASYTDAQDSTDTQSDTATATGDTPATAPSGFAGTAASSTSITWTWTDNSSNETGFKLYDSSNTLIATIATANTTSYTETGLTASTSYTRKIAAYNGAGNSAYSNSATVSTSSASSGTGTAPTSPGLKSPEDGAVLTTVLPTFTIGRATDVDNNLSTYTLLINPGAGNQKTITFNNPSSGATFALSNATVTAGDSNISITLTNDEWLKYGEDYTWKARATDDQSNSTDSDIRTFTIASAASPADAGSTPASPAAPKRVTTSSGSQPSTTSELATRPPSITDVIEAIERGEIPTRAPEALQLEELAKQALLRRERESFNLLAFLKQFFPDDWVDRFDRYLAYLIDTTRTRLAALFDRARTRLASAFGFGADQLLALQGLLKQSASEIALQRDAVEESVKKEVTDVSEEQASHLAELIASLRNTRQVADENLKERVREEVPTLSEEQLAAVEQLTTQIPNRVRNLVAEERQTFLSELKGLPRLAGETIVGARNLLARGYDILVTARNNRLRLAQQNEQRLEQAGEPLREAAGRSRTATILAYETLSGAYEKPPKITDVTIETIEKDRVAISWKTSRLTTGKVNWGDSLAYGASEAGLGGEAHSEELAGSHEVEITGLTPGDRFFFEVVATGPRGNSVADAYYSFVTPNE